jgi:hypothetical protein
MGASPLDPYRPEALEDLPVLEGLHAIHGETDELGGAPVGDALDKGIETLGVLET